MRNHLFPTRKLEQKVMLKSRYRRLYGDPIPPYQTIMASLFVAENIKQALELLVGYRLAS
jgi:hypothetical protein